MQLLILTLVMVEAKRRWWEWVWCWLGAVRMPHYRQLLLVGVLPQYQ
jgi:hypothetical protein